MTLEASSIQQAPDAGSVATLPVALPGDDADGGARVPRASLSRLSYWIAWLFGVEALLGEPDEPDNWQIWD
jgi:hypothetical protein